MNELIAQVTAMLHDMWRRRWIGMAVAWLVGILGILALLRMHDHFEASARVYVDTKSVLKPLMHDLAVEPDIDQTINMLARSMLTRPNMELLVDRTQEAGGAGASSDREKTIETFLRDIKLTGSGRDNIFTFTYRDFEPARARLVVEKLVSLFVESDLGAKAKDAQSARDFIDQQIKTYEARLGEAENRLKDFKVRNLGMADASGKDYFARMSALSEELAKITVELRAAEQSRDALKHELTGEDFVLLPDPTTQPAANATPELDTRLDTQRKQLDDLLRRYTDLHPDVVATRRLIARLEEQKQQEIERRRATEVKQPVRRPVSNNPVFQQIKLALAESEAAVAALRVRTSDLQARVNQLRASATKAPQVEAELAQLNRDYDVIRKNYEAMVGRREKASLSEDVDATRLANFRVIDPPRSSPKPVFPNRQALAPLVLVMALGAGLAAALVMSQLMPTFNSAASLRAITQRPVLGSVSMLMTDGLVRAGRRHAIAFASATLGLVLVYGGWIAWMSGAISA